MCLLVIGFSICAPAAAQKTDRKRGKSKSLTAAEVFKQASPGIAAIDCLGENRARISSATGFIVGENGKIITNFHVIRNCANISVRLANGDIFESSYVVDTDERKDLALIRIKAVSLPVLALGDSNQIEVGAAVYSIGNPSGLQNNLQQGLVSGFRQMEGYKLVQVSTPINPGNSGGPILDDRGRVIAVTAQKIIGAEGLGFAIPINYAKGFLDTTSEKPFPAFAEERKKAAAPVASAAKQSGAGGGIGSASSRLNSPVGFPILISIDRLEAFLRGRIGVWTADQAKAAMGNPKIERTSAPSQVVEGARAYLEFDTPGTSCRAVVLIFGDKLMGAFLIPATPVNGEGQLTWVKNRFRGDVPAQRQLGTLQTYVFAKAKTEVRIRTDGSVDHLYIY
jgi:hypothetical protein